MTIKFEDFDFDNILLNEKKSREIFSFRHLIRNFDLLKNLSVLDLIK